MTINECNPITRDKLLKAMSLYDADKDANAHKALELADLVIRRDPDHPSAYIFKLEILSDLESPAYETFLKEFCDKFPDNLSGNYFTLILMQRQKKYNLFLDEVDSVIKKSQEKNFYDSRSKNKIYDNQIEELNCLKFTIKAKLTKDSRFLKKAIEYADNYRRLRIDNYYATKLFANILATAGAISAFKIIKKCFQLIRQLKLPYGKEFFSKKYLYGLAHHLKDEYSKAIEYYKADLSADNIYLPIVINDLLIAENSLNGSETAISLAKELNAKFPNNMVINKYIAHICFLEGDFKEADIWLSKDLQTEYPSVATYLYSIFIKTLNKKFVEVNDLLKEFDKKVKTGFVQKILSINPEKYKMMCTQIVKWKTRLHDFVEYSNKCKDNQNYITDINTIWNVIFPDHSLSTERNVATEKPNDLSGKDINVDNATIEIDSTVYVKPQEKIVASNVQELQFVKDLPSIAKQNFLAAESLILQKNDLYNLQIIMSYIVSLEGVIRAIYFQSFSNYYKSNNNCVKLNKHYDRRDFCIKKLANFIEREAPFELGIMIETLKFVTSDRRKLYDISVDCYNFLISSKNISEVIDDKAIDLLLKINREFRNPVIHCEEDYDLNDVEFVRKSVITLLNRIYHIPDN